MKKAIDELMGWLWSFADLLKLGIVLGVFIGILYEDIFGVLGRFGTLMAEVGADGLAGLVALVILLTWYKGK
tara:strand:+ start:264 stop:479 length:216 start_codon:yes stop_codon:yes gene_type:complete